MTQAATPPKAIRTGEVYVRNLSALWEVDPKLAMAIEAVHPDDVPAVETARDGEATVKVKGVYLHSRYRPVEEAQKWAEAQGCENRYAVVVGGFGMGHHVKALWSRMPGEAVVIVGEADLGVLKAALEAGDFSEMIASRRLMIFTQLDRGQLVERLEPRGTLFLGSEESEEGVGAHGGIENVKFAVHEASNRVAAEFHRTFQKLMVEFVAYIRTGLITLRDNSVLTCRNAANNLGRYATTPPIDLMRDIYKGKPAILVAAGPSLAKNMHLLREINEPRRAVVIAVQTMLKPLLAAGIDPDFVTSLDYNTVSTRFFENLEDAAGKGGAGRRGPAVHLVAEAKANWNVLDVYGGTMSLIENDFSEKLLRGSGIAARAGLKAGATVAHLSFYLAEYLGCDPIILVGQDLGFVDGLYYKPGTAIHETWGVELGRFCTLETKEWERIVRSRLILRKIPDIHGNLMYTEEQFFVYLQQFERDFAASRHKVIDATEGGARKEGTQIMALREAIDRFCGAGIGGDGPGAVRPWKEWRCDVPALLKRARETLALRRTQAMAMKETCEAVGPVLEKMVKHQEDSERMQGLFVEVDRLRAKVGADPGTFEMAAFLNTIGEMRRFQADLMVKGQQGDHMAKQRRQLTRDKLYVKDLGLGAERLIAIIDEAMGRLGKQIAAAEAGKPWPREVAGASA